MRRRLLVVGCGSIGRRHIANLLALEAGEVCATDALEDRRAQIHAEFGIRTFADVEEALSAGFDAVLIATPPNSHIRLATDAAKHGCHLFIEKPLSDSLEQTDELITCADDGHLRTLVGCNMRFHPGLQTLKGLVERGVAGHITSILAQFGQYLPDWHPLEDYRASYSASRSLGGGVILDAIHEIDYVHWLLGDIRAVSCFAGKLSGLEIDTEDTAAILLAFAGGAFGEIHLDYVQRSYSRMCQVIGDQGTIRWDFGSGDVSIFEPGVSDQRVVHQPASWQPNDMYMDEMRHFLRCLNNEEPPMLDVSGAARVLRVALAARSSAELGRTVNLE